MTTSLQNFIQSTLQKRPVILDGGMGRELERVGAPFGRPEWSALALLEAPETVGAVYDSFIKAGADIITINSYAVVPFHIGEERFNQQGRALINLAGRLAQKSAQAVDHPVYIAGCIPPVMGSYKTEVNDTKKALALTSIMLEEQEQYADLWLCETLSSYEDANIAYSAINKSGTQKSVIYAFVIEKQADGTLTLRSGDDIQHSLQHFAALSQADGIFFNCSDYRIMEEAILMTRKLLGNSIYLGVYPNRFITIDRDVAVDVAGPELDNSLSLEHFSSLGSIWHQAGADVIGGCCGIGANFIKALSANWK